MRRRKTAAEASLASCECIVNVSRVRVAGTCSVHTVWQAWPFDCGETPGVLIIIALVAVVLQCSAASPQSRGRKPGPCRRGASVTQTCWARELRRTTHGLHWRRDSTFCAPPQLLFSALLRRRLQPRRRCGRLRPRSDSEEQQQQQQQVAAEEVHGPKRPLAGSRPPSQTDRPSQFVG